MSGCQKIWLAALAVGLVALSSAAAWAYPPGYVQWGTRYDQRLACLSSATVRLTAAQVPSGHVAVWSGVSSPGTANWLQAGIAEISGSSQYNLQSFRYVEWRSHWVRRFIRLGPGASLQVRLSRLGDSWRLQAGNRAWTVRIGPHASCQIGAESWDNPGPNMVRGRVSYYGGRYEFYLPS